MLSLNIPSYGNYSDDSEGCSYGQLVIGWQLHHNNAPTHASRLVQSSLVKHQITQVTQHPLQSRFGTLRLLAFPKVKSPLKEKRFQTIDEIQENETGLLIVIGRTV